MLLSLRQQGAGGYKSEHHGESLVACLGDEESKSGTAAQISTQREVKKVGHFLSHLLYFNFYFFSQ